MNKNRFEAYAGFSQGRIDIRVPGINDWPDKDDLPVRALHLNKPTKMVGGRDYIVAESAKGSIYVNHGRASGVRKGGGVKDFWKPGKKDFFILLEACVQRGYEVVGQMQDDGRWVSEKYRYPKVPFPKARV
ncbi:MAG: hypothetical protein M0Z78_08860 [Betaproteobacteria bacterium]|nr:hypothetical protein [Betaproteobacteria bacterium]